MRVEGGEDVAASRRRSPGVTSRTPGAPWSPRSGATRSPRPSTSAGPPARKNGTSEPSRAATRAAGVGVELGAPGLERAVDAAAASDEPPARPAATGIRFSSRAASAGAGPGPPGQPPPTAARAAASARSTRLSAGRPGVEARRRGACRACAAGRREAEPVGEGERHEDRVEVVEAVGAPPDDGQGQVELGRREPDDRGEAAERVRTVGHAVAVRLARPRPSGADRAERLAQGQPLPDREGLRPPVRVDAGRREGRRRPAPASTGSWRDRTLWSILRRSRKRGLDQPPQLVLVVGVEPVVGVVRLDDDDRRLDRRLRLEGGGRDAERDPDPGVVLHEDRQVAHLPGRRRDPLGDLALDHEHEPLRPRRRRRGARAGSGW